GPGADLHQRGQRISLMAPVDHVAVGHLLLAADRGPVQPQAVPPPVGDLPVPVGVTELGVHPGHRQVVGQPQLRRGAPAAQRRRGAAEPGPAGAAGRRVAVTASLVTRRSGGTAGGLAIVSCSVATVWPAVCPVASAQLRLLPAGTGTGPGAPAGTAPGVSAGT